MTPTPQIRRSDSGGRSGLNPPRTIPMRHNYTARIFAIIATATLAAGCGGGVTGGSADMVIAYTDDDGNAEYNDLYIKRADSAPQKIVSGSVRDFAISTKGGMVAFSGAPGVDTEGSDGVYVVRPDSSQPEKLIDSRSIDGLSSYISRQYAPPGIGEMALSPDGSKVAFRVSSNIERYNADSPHQLHIINTDGTGYRRIYDAPQNGILHSPVFSPDGNQIAFIETAVDTPGVYAINTDGSGLHMVIAAEDVIPNYQSSDSLLKKLVWSASGNKLAISYDYDDDSDSAVYANAKIYLINADGSGGADLKLPTHDEITGKVSFPPDGSQIAYTVGLFKPVYVVNVDGSGSKKFTPSNDKRLIRTNSVFSPDGKSVLIFGSDADGSQACVIRIDVASGDFENLPPCDSASSTADRIEVGAL